MNTGGRLIAGSHNRNEFVLINADENARVRFTHCFQFAVNFDMGFYFSVQKSLTFLLFFLLDLGFTGDNQLRFRGFSISIKILYLCS